MFTRVLAVTMGIVLSIAFCMPTLADPGYHGFELVKPANSIIPEELTEEINISLKKVSYSQALEKIAELGDLKLNYNESKIPLKTEVSIVEEKITVIDALIYLMKVTNTELHITEKQQLIIAPVPKNERKTGRIQGEVVENGDGSPIPLVNILLKGHKTGAATDLDGNFYIPALPLGLYDLDISCLGFETKVLENVRVDSEETVNLEVGLKPAVFHLQDVTVTPGTFAFMENSTTTPQTMSREDIESVGQLGEDIYRAINRLPGLSSGDYSAQFSVRGGNNDETLVLMDGLELYEPFHMKDFNEGALSIIDVDAIEGVELMTGGFTAEYGNKTSGVLNISSRKSNGDHNLYGLSLSMMNAKVFYDGKLNNKGDSWYFSARRGYMDLVFKMMNETGMPIPLYYDTFLKLNYRLNPKHKLTFSILHAGDTMFMDNDELDGDGYKMRLDSRYDNSYIWATLNSVVAPKLVAESVFSFGNISKDRSGRNYGVGDNSDIDFNVRDNQYFNVFNAKQNWMYDYSERMLFKTGWDLKFLGSEYQYKKSDRDPVYDPVEDIIRDEIFRTEYDFHKEGYILGVYLSNRVKLTDPLTCELGLRYDYADWTNNSNLNPRINAAYKLADRSYFRAGWGIYSQFHGLQDLNIQDNSNKFYPAEKSNQWTAGLEHFFGFGTQMRLEGYYKRTTDICPSQRNWTNDIEFFPEMGHDRILVFPELITSRGVELYLRHNFGQKLTFSGSYALAYVDEEVDRIEISSDNVIDASYDKKHPHPNDQRHTVNLEGTYRPNRKWSFNLSYAYHTGWPYTFETLRVNEDSEGNYRYEYTPNKLYSDRLPAYQRLDMRITRRIQMRSGHLRLFAEAINLTNHTNIYGYDYDPVEEDDGSFSMNKDHQAWFGLIPSLGISWTGNL